MLKKIVNKAIEILILITSFLFGLSLYNKTSLFLIVLFALATLRLKKVDTYIVRISKYSLFVGGTLMAFTVINFLYSDHMLQVGITYFFLPLCAFLTGFFIAQTKEVEKPFYNKVIFSAAFGFLGYGILNIYQRYAVGYNDLWWVAAGRMCQNYWTGIDMWPTIEATYFLPISSLVFFAFVINKNKWLKLVYAMAFIAAAGASMDIGSRSVIVIPFLMSMTFLVYYFKSSKIIQSDKFALVIKLIVLITAVGVLYQINFGGIKTTIETSNLYSRLNGKTYDSVNGLLDINGREDRYYSIFEEMPTHLLGGISLGGNVTEGGMGSAHNTWLDMYRVAGIIPFVLFIICTVMLLKRIWYLAKSYTLYNNRVTPLLSILIMLNIEFMFESMFALNTQMINFYFMLCGMADCIYITMVSEQEGDNKFILNRYRRKRRDTIPNELTPQSEGFGG